MLRAWEITTFCVFTSVVCWLANYVNQLVPIAYMDEIFHVRQAQRYCEGDFAYWDSKITTPPGLYLSSWPFSLITKCSLDVLRSTNILFLLGNVYIMYRIQHLLHGSTILSSLAVAILPVNFFFTFLYYTDAGCIFCLLLTYLFYLQRQHYLAALAGLVGLFMRQTTIIWVFFVACLTLAEIVNRHLKDVKKTKKAKLIKNIVIDAFQNCAGYGIVGVLFVAFLAVNGAIVLGDKDAHQAVLHIPQIGYFLLFSLLFGAPYILSLRNFLRFIDFATRRPIVIFVAALVVFGLFENFIHVHPYLLADNRHYTFYLWRRFLSQEKVRQALVVVYIYIAFCLYSCVRHLGNLWIALFTFCLAAMVIPAGLIEFRYFLWPFILLRLHFRQEKQQLFVEIVSAIAINCITFYMFLYGTFIWKHEPGSIQRFMW